MVAIIDGNRCRRAQNQVCLCACVLVCKCACALVCLCAYACVLVCWCACVLDGMDGNPLPSMMAMVAISDGNRCHH